MSQLTINLKNEHETVAFGNNLAAAVKQLNCHQLIIFLHGDLGAGKTTMTRGFVHGFGFSGNVKSPTYTLVEPYEQPDFAIYHFDLYRLADPEELEFLGIRDYFSKTSYCLIEWPEKARGCLPPEDLVINIVYNGLERDLTIKSCTKTGEQVITQLNLSYVEN